MCWYLVDRYGRKFLTECGTTAFLLAVRRGVAEKTIALLTGLNKITEKSFLRRDQRLGKFEKNIQTCTALKGMGTQ
jgi:hypothetical protein